MQGWECPRCKKVNSPYVDNCDCQYSLDSRFINITNIVKLPKPMAVTYYGVVGTGNQY